MGNEHVEIKIQYQPANNQYGIDITCIPNNYFNTETTEQLYSCNFRVYSRPFLCIHSKCLLKEKEEKNKKTICHNQSPKNTNKTANKSGFQNPHHNVSIIPDRAKVWSWFEYNTRQGKNITVTTITRDPLASH